MAYVNQVGKTRHGVPKKDHTLSISDLLSFTSQNVFPFHSPTMMPFMKYQYKTGFQSLSFLSYQSPPEEGRKKQLLASHSEGDIQGKRFFYFCSCFVSMNTELLEVLIVYKHFYPNFLKRQFPIYFPGMYFMCPVLPSSSFTSLFVTV